MAEESSPYEAEPLTATKETENTSYLPSKPSLQLGQVHEIWVEISWDLHETCQTKLGQEEETAAGAPGTTATHSGEAVGKSKD